MQLTDATVGMMVQCLGKPLTETKFIGTVKGVTVNSTGEAVLLIDTVQRRPTWVQDGHDLVREGMTPTGNGEFVHVTRAIHPSIVQPITNVTHLMEKD